MHYEITQGDISLQTVRDLILGKVSTISVADEVMQNVITCYDYIQNKVSDTSELHYGINTGFGSLCNVAVGKEDITQLQVNLLLSHACGLGDRVPSQLVRLMLFLKIKNLVGGYSGVSPQLIQQLVALYNHDITPIVYQLGSLGASGDLAPLAHLALPLIGEGRVVYKGLEMQAREALQMAGLMPHTLQAKEGLALINGTQFSAAYLSYEVLSARDILTLATNVAAVSSEAYVCDSICYDARIHQVRRHGGQIDIAQQLRDWLLDSRILEQQGKYSVQDPYSFRCVPQVHGACKAAIDHAEQIIQQEINAVTDNPNIFSADDRIISGGNFHAQPLAMVIDYLCIALAELANISERRTYQLINGDRSLPVYLAHKPGTESGYMIAQYTAASIVSQNKQLCMPASVDSIVSSKGQEDHVSMAANAATKCARVVDNVWRVVAIELMIAMRAMEHREMSSCASATRSWHKAYRAAVPTYHGDHIIHDEMKSTIQFITQDAIHL